MLYIGCEILRGIFSMQTQSVRLCLSKSPAVPEETSWQNTTKWVFQLKYFWCQCVLIPSWCFLCGWNSSLMQGVIMVLFSFVFPFSPFRIVLLQWLTFYWSCFQFKNSLQRIIETSNSYHGVAKCSRGKFNICVHISGSIGPITLIRVSLQRSFPAAELGLKWSILVKGGDVRNGKRPTLVTAGYGRHRRQWVNNNPPK